MHHVVIHVFMDITRSSDSTAGQMDGEAGWWSTSGNIRVPPRPLVRIKRMHRQQQHFVNNELNDYLETTFQMD